MAALSLKGRALRWLAQRDHTRAELGRRLRQHLARQAATGGDAAQPDAPAAIEALLDELVAKGFVSDERAAESLLAGRGARLGPLRLQRELQRRGFDAALAAGTVARSRSDEQARAQALWLRRFGTPATDPRERARQARFLAARGFSAGVVARIVRGLDAD